MDPSPETILIEDYNKVVIVGLVLKRKSPQQLAVYVPQKDVIFHRYSWMSFLSKSHSKDESAVLAEITVPKNNNYLTSHEYVRKVLNGFIKMKVIDDPTQVKESRV